MTYLLVRGNRTIQFYFFHQSCVVPIELRLLVPIPNILSFDYRSVTTRRMAARRLEEGVQEEAPKLD